MTSEVVVMNRMGLALAADSAVTVSFGANSKVRESALKVFMLSKYRPVGVMIYNNALLLGVPLETIVKMFRQHLGNEELKTLSDYGNRFIEFLDGNTGLFPEQVQDRFFISALEAEFEQIISKARDTKSVEIYTGGEEKPQSALKTVQKEIEKKLSFWESKNDAEYFQEVEPEQVCGRNSGQVSILIRQKFLEWSLEDNDTKNLNQIAINLITKDHFPAHILSGIVIAGFGKAEHFPVVKSFEIGGMYDNKLKVRPANEIKISDKNYAAIIPFAYRDMVDGFINGISSSVRTHIDDAAVFIREMPLRAIDIAEQLSPAEKQRLKEIIVAESSRKAEDFAKSVLEVMKKGRNGFFTEYRHCQ